MKRLGFKTAIAVVSTLVILSISFIAGCGGDAGDSTAAGGVGGGDSGTLTGGITETGFSLTSEDFSEGGTFPLSSACTDMGGGNVSPQLSWQDAPAGTAGYAIIMDDEDPPCGSGNDACRHWAVFNIQGMINRFEGGEDISQIGGVSQGENYSGTDGYAGPCSHSTHLYKISIYALDESMPVVEEGSVFTRSAFASEYAGHILATDTLSVSFTP